MNLDDYLDKHGKPASKLQKKVEYLTKIGANSSSMTTVHQYWDLQLTMMEYKSEV